MRTLVCTAVLICVVLAIAGCSAAIHPADRLLYHADSLFTQGKNAEAAKEIDAAIAKAPRRHATYVRAVEILNDRHRWRELARVGDELIARAISSDLDVRLSKGEIAAYCAATSQAHWSAGEKLQGEAVARNGLALDPNNPGLLNNLGYFYADRGVNIPEALKLTKRASELLPGDGMVLDSLGWAQFKSGDYKSATKTLKKAVSLHPESAEIRYHLGAVYARRGMIQEAEVELRKSITLDASVTEAANALEKLHK